MTLFLKNIASHCGLRSLKYRPLHHYLIFIFCLLLDDKEVNKALFALESPSHLTVKLSITWCCTVSWNHPGRHPDPWNPELNDLSQFGAGTRRKRVPRARRTTCRQSTCQFALLWFPENERKLKFNSRVNSKFWRIGGPLKISFRGKS